MARFFLFAMMTYFFSSGSADQNYCVNAPCGPGNEQCGPLFDVSSPQFHVRDSSCAENDPNFPFYDPLHGMYHLFYQNHLCEPMHGLGQGPVIGHVGVLCFAAFFSFQRQLLFLLLFNFYY